MHDAGERIGRSRRRAGHRAALGLAVVLVLAVVVLAPVASAAPRRSPLKLRQCFADVAARRCLKAPHRSLELADDVAVSPDGRSAYVAAGQRELPALGADAITEFTRDASGRLKPTGCVTFAGARGCRAAGVSLEYVHGLTVSPDGRDLYAVSGVGIVEFSRSASGRLGPIGCVAFEPEPPPGPVRCTPLVPGADLHVTGLALSPDGADLYATAGTYGTGNGIHRYQEWVGRLYELARGPDGTLTETGCFGPVGEPGCGTLQTGYLAEPLVGPDGSALYAIDEDGLERFPRAADGSLGAPECLLARGGDCGPGNPAYRVDEAIAISPDASRLYLGTVHGTVEYSIASGGALAKAAATPIPSFALALSPDGSRLYGAVYGTDHGGIRTFDTEGGALSPLGGPFPVEGVEGMAVAPDGGTLLATSSCACHGSLLVLGTGRQEADFLAESERDHSAYLGINTRWIGGQGESPPPTWGGSRRSRRT